MVTTTVQELYQSLLQRAPSAFEAGELLRFVTGVSPHEAQGSALTPTPEMAAKLAELLDKRAAGIPLQYLLGEWEFFSLPFKVGPGVLIPRQDTETLVETALALLKKRGLEDPALLDLCSGTGCVAVSIAAHLPDAAVTALEFSRDAYPYLEQNIALNKVAVTPVLADLRDYTHPQPLDMIVSNPPYISRREFPNLQVEVGHEPLAALDGGEDGLLYFRAIARRYREQLKPSGILLLEIGAGQESDVAGILGEHGFVGLRQHLDLNGIPRIIEAKKP